MRFLSYPEIFELFQREILTVDLDEKIFDGMDTKGVIDLDQQMKDRMFQGNFLEWKNDVHAKRDLLIHTSFSSSVWKTMFGKYVVTRGEIFSIPTLERVRSSDPNIMAFVDISDELYEKGFRLANGGLTDIHRRQFASVDITNVEKNANLIPNDHFVASLRMVTIP